LTVPATVADQSATHPHGASWIVALGERTNNAVQRRAGRFRVMLLVFVLLLPLLLTSLLDGR